MIYYWLSHIPEFGGHLLITSLTHNKKIVDSSGTDIVLVLTVYFSLSLEDIQHCTYIKDRMLTALNKEMLVLRNMNNLTKLL